MKKLILAGIVIIICCLVFLIVRQNSSQADIGMDIYAKTYPVPFGDWVQISLSALYEGHNIGGDYFLDVIGPETIEDKFRFRIVAAYNANTELGRQWYQETFPKIKRNIRQQCEIWTLQGYPISLNDFQFDIQASQ